MPKLVAPDGIMYVVNDTGPDQADLAERRADLPPKKNLNQLLGWCGPADVTSQTWQLLDKVRRAENDGEYIPLVDSAASALKMFNRHCGTSHTMSSSFHTQRLRGVLLMEADKIARWSDACCRTQSYGGHQPGANPSNRPYKSLDSPSAAKISSAARGEIAAPCGARYPS